jgi:hypothetical protein
MLREALQLAGYVLVRSCIELSSPYEVDNCQKHIKDLGRKCHIERLAFSYRN